MQVPEIFFKIWNFVTKHGPRIIIFALIGLGTNTKDDAKLYHNTLTVKVFGEGACTGTS